MKGQNIIYGPTEKYGPFLRLNEKKCSLFNIYGLLISLFIDSITPNVV